MEQIQVPWDRQRPLPSDQGWTFPNMPNCHCLRLCVKLTDTGIVTIMARRMARMKTETSIANHGLASHSVAESEKKEVRNI